MKQTAPDIAGGLVSRDNRAGESIRPPVRAGPTVKRAQQRYGSALSSEAPNMRLASASSRAISHAACRGSTPVG